MADKTKMKDLVVILPGITSSFLQKDGKEIWAISGQAVWQALTSLGESVQQLKLVEDDPNADFAPDGIKASRLAPDISLVPGLVKIDGYSALSRLITSNFEVTRGDIYHDPEDKPANYYEFPYDWRRDNRINARLFKKLVDKRLKCWRESSGAQDAKVILLAHSMGGLISRYYLEVLEGWQDCQALFTFGTPYRGSLNAVDFLANGYKKLFMDLTEVMRSFPSVYQLMPIYKMLKVGDQYQRIAETNNLPNIDPMIAADALAFHREIEAAVKRHQEDGNYWRSYKTIPIVGIEQPTLQSATLVDGKLTASQELPDWIDGVAKNGDGTVPYVSAIPIELSKAFQDTYIAERHGSIQNNSQILQQLSDRLRTIQFPELEAIRAPQKRILAAISLSVDDLYLADEPVVISAKIVNSEQQLGGLKAQITPVTGEGNPQAYDFQFQEDGWVLNLDNLASGQYRLQVQTKESNSQAPFPVHDVFEIVR